jgi:hypothetical protein
MRQSVAGRAPSQPICVRAGLDLPASPAALPRWPETALGRRLARDGGAGDARGTGLPIAVHRTFLALDGGGKAPVNPAKMMLRPCLIYWTVDNLD